MNGSPSQPVPRNSHLETLAADRRGFLKGMGGTALAVAASSLAMRPAAAAEEAATPRPAEDLVRELFATLSAEQKQSLALPWDHGAEDGKATPTRLRMFNRAINGKLIGENYTAAQQELNERILRAICSDEEGYQRISRNGTFDTGGGFKGCGAIFFGDPSGEEKFSWVFSGHHLTVRCDGNSQPGAAFGGPMFYGHSPNGYNTNNVFYFQTKAVQSVYETLNDEQRQRVIAEHAPGERESSIEFRGEGEERPGIGYDDLTAEQREHMRKVMREILSPYRQEDADEVMQLVKENGGWEKMHLAFYRDKNMLDSQPWHYWRIEGPGFVWNYRVLPHVHCYVSIASQEA